MSAAIRNEALVRALQEAQEQGIKQRDIARAAGISEQALTNCKAGTRPSLRTAQRLAKALGKPVEEIFPDGKVVHKVLSKTPDSP